MNKEYSKYVITIPSKQIEAVGWKVGAELEAIVKNGKIVLKPKDDNT